MKALQRIVFVLLCTAAAIAVSPPSATVGGPPHDMTVCSSGDWKEYTVTDVVQAGGNWWVLGDMEYKSGGTFPWNFQIPNHCIISATAGVSIEWTDGCTPWDDCFK